MPDTPLSPQTAPRPKKSGRFRRLKRRIEDGIYNLLGPPVLGGLLNLWAHTLKLEFDGYEHFERAVDSGRPIIFVFWHEDLMSIFLGHLRHRLGKVGVMLSQSRDGEKVARIIARYDLTPIRASTSRGAVRGFIELYHWLVKPGAGSRYATIAIDGPRGPRRQAKAGAAMLARKAQALVLPIAFDYSSKKVTRSWDRHLIPKPFAKMYAYFGEPIDAAEWSKDNEASARIVTDALNGLKAKAGLP